MGSLIFLLSHMVCRVIVKDCPVAVPLCAKESNQLSEFKFYPCNTTLLLEETVAYVA
jgi:hypothetical protein